MAGRPRTRATNGHAADVRNYKARLARSGIPQAGAVDRALHLAVVKWIQAVRYSAPPGVSGTIQTQVIDHLMKSATRRLAKAEFDPEASREILERRLHEPLPKDPLGRRNPLKGHAPG